MMRLPTLASDVLTQVSSFVSYARDVAACRIANFVLNTVATKDYRDNLYRICQLGLKQVQIYHGFGTGANSDSIVWSEDIPFPQTGDPNAN